MKTLFIRIFLLAMLGNSILVFAGDSPTHDDKMSTACPPAAAGTAQSSEGQQSDKRKMKKEKKSKKKDKDHKEDDNYPGYGNFG